MLSALCLPTEIGEALTASRTVRKISFTGSTRVGQLLMQQLRQYRQRQR
jgi:acyl-CoA reductase-like NAD-dependent aldehyde dehydrogenase